MGQYDNKNEHDDITNPERVWDSLYHNNLCDIEEDGIDQEFPNEKWIRRLPRFSFKWSLGVLIVGIISAIILSWFSRDGYDGSGWCSALFQNLAMGMVTGLVLLWFSNKQQRVISGYTSIVEVMRKRIESFRSTLANMRDPNFVFFNIGSFDAGRGWLHVHLNLIYVMESHLRYFNKHMKENFGFGRLVEAISLRLKEIGDVDQRVINDRRDENIRVVCGDVWQLEQSILRDYEKIVNLIEEKMFNAKFGGKELTRFEKMQLRKGCSGDISRTIMHDVELEKMK